MQEASTSVSEMALKQCRDVVRRWAGSMHGYICQEAAAEFMLAFHSGEHATNFCLMVSHWNNSWHRPVPVSCALSGLFLCNWHNDAMASVHVHDSCSMYATCNIIFFVTVLCNCKLLASLAPVLDRPFNKTTAFLFAQPRHAHLILYWNAFPPKEVVHPFTCDSLRLLCVFRYSHLKIYAHTKLFCPLKMFPYVSTVARWLNYSDNHKKQWMW